MDDLVLRNDLYYKKFTNDQFNGEISGIVSGGFKNGKKNGEWLFYYENGQLYFRHQRYKGKRHGIFEKYNEDGSVIKIEHYENGELIKALG